MNSPLPLAPPDPSTRRILVTTALPYANGDIHLGHLLGYIQADIWARFHKMRRAECWHVCADDAHGAPVMLRADDEGVPAEELIGKMRAAHIRDFAAFHVDFDNYHTTHSPENEALSVAVYRALRDRGLIAERDITQLRDPEKGMFLPDRYVRGECPKCAAQDQYGDSCEQCGSVYSSAELKNPRSTVSGATPELRESRHCFFQLGKLADELREWITAQIPNPANPAEKIPRLQKEAANKLREWFADGLRDWDISRDPPYFGFRIPDRDDEKYFYVWLDAPIGYMASFQNLCDRLAGKGGPEFADFWSAAAADQTELYHFIGKDILYFHGLFWPAMLKNSGHRRPTRLFANGFVTVDSAKMSKSRGVSILAEKYIAAGLDPEWLRYYYAAKSTDRIADMDLGLEDFTAKVNSDLVGKLVNIPSRVGGLLLKFCNGELAGRPFQEPTGLGPGPDANSESDSDSGSGPDSKSKTESERVGRFSDLVARAYEERRYHEAVNLAMRLADRVNADIDADKPWDLAKDKSRREDLRRVCTDALNGFKFITAMLKPMLPRLAADVESFLNIPPLQWDNAAEPLPAGHKLRKYRHLMSRVEDKHIARLLEGEIPEAETKAEAKAKAEADAKAKAKKPEAEKQAADDSQFVDIADFAKLDIRVARVAAAAEVEGADRLLRLTLDIGDGRMRNVFAGIRGHYRAEDLAGRNVIFLANLKPRKMRFGISEGMALAANSREGDPPGVILLDAPDAPTGAKVS